MESHDLTESKPQRKSGQLSLLLEVELLALLLLLLPTRKLFTQRNSEIGDRELKEPQLGTNKCKQLGMEQPSDDEL